jgi:hypothetical protein
MATNFGGGGVGQYGEPGPGVELGPQQRELQQPLGASEGYTLDWQESGMSDGWWPAAVRDALRWVCPLAPRRVDMGQLPAILCKRAAGRSTHQVELKPRVEELLHDNVQLPSRVKLLQLDLWDRAGASGDAALARAHYSAPPRPSPDHAHWAAPYSAFDSNMH